MVQDGADYLFAGWGVSYGELLRCGGTYGDVYLAEHVDAFTGVDERYVLRRRYDYGTYLQPVNTYS